MGLVGGSRWPERDRKTDRQRNPKFPDRSAVHYHNVHTTRPWNSDVQLVQETRAKRRLAHTG